MMNNKQPLISVYMPTKNRRVLLSRAIKSIVEQSYQNIEVIVIDDGSTDDTFEYLSNLNKTDINLVILRNEISKGACAARNRAIAIAKGEFLTGLDDDDVFLPERLKELMEAYSDDYAFVCSSMIWDYGKKQRIIDQKEMKITLKEQLDYNEATTQVLVKKERVDAVCGFDESFVACQDYDLWTRLIYQYGDAYRISKPSYIINDTGSSERMIGDPKSVKGYQQFQEKHGHLMSNRNKMNQSFMMTRRLRERLPLTELIKHADKGHFFSKFRYYLSSNFRFIKQFQRYLYKNN